MVIRVIQISILISKMIIKKLLAFFMEFYNILHNLAVSVTETFKYIFRDT
jgi:hypothetical protein